MVIICSFDNPPIMAAIAPPILRLCDDTLSLRPARSTIRWQRLEMAPVDNALPAHSPHRFASGSFHSLFPTNTSSSRTTLPTTSLHPDYLPSPLLVRLRPPDPDPQ
eukprot:TRINITY_DN4866_c0_g2_i1.p3 TRINITY_DN4866_c0_g2~~TRINITY_DN4866_c0_g2_i1.p3  ORF type:complete len:106 (+),score=1.16 TRINITY_DN4866_c0_g2_i1:965-1282(+)